MASNKFENMKTEKANVGADDGAVYDSVERGKSSKMRQGVASKEEQEERAASLRTQGRSGCKLPRINMALSPDNYDYITTMARATGKTLTGFCNYVIEQHRKENPETYDQAKKFLSELDTDN